MRMLVGLVAIVYCFQAIAGAQDQPNSGLLVQEGDFSVQLQPSQYVRLGHWTGLTIESTGDSIPSHYRISTVDGNDTPVEYSGVFQRDPDRPNRAVAWFRLGRSVGTLQFELMNSDPVDADEVQVVSRIDVPLRKDMILKSTQPLIYVLGDYPALTDAVRASAGSPQPATDPVVIQVETLADLPPGWLGYDGVEAIVMPIRSAEELQDVTPAQLDAMATWLKRGGKLVISISSNAVELVEGSGLLESFSPGKLIGSSSFTNSSRLESFANSKDQLIPINGDPLPLLHFETTDGLVLVSDGEQPLIIEQARGFGELVVVGFDLMSPELTQWDSFGSLAGQLVFDATPSSRESARSSGRSTVGHLGYTDLVGQLRVPLDRFSRVGFIAFTWIAILIGLYILCIGPLDYFLLRRGLGKMELTWITFPLLSILFCGLAFGISRWTRPAELQMNQLEVIDIDVASGQCRGSVWTTLYSPDGHTLSLDLDRQHAMGFKLSESILTWQGLPGDGLGGMATQPIAGLQSRQYRQTTQLDSNQQVDSHVADLPLQVSSSRALFSQWWAENHLQIRSRPTLRTRSDRVTGQIKNPFDFELRNCQLLVDTWAYVLDRPLGPGQTFDIQTETREKTLRASLTRRYRQAEDDNRSISVPWDPGSTQVPRIAMVMMFHQAAGGDNYTGLTHGYQAFTDLSNHLNLKRAILVGEATVPGAKLTLNDGSVDGSFDQQTTMVRIILPVEVDTRR